MRDKPHPIEVFVPGTSDRNGNPRVQTINPKVMQRVGLEQIIEAMAIHLFGGDRSLQSTQHLTSDTTWHKRIAPMRRLLW